MTSLTATITGRVQGVGYRAYVHATAADLGVDATATNMPDGSVIVEATGERAALEVLVMRLQKGPPHAKVENVEITKILG